VRTGFIDHIGIGVPDLGVAKRYYDDLMPILGLRPWFPTTDTGEFNFGPDGATGPQIFFYQALEPTRHSRHGTGLQHLSFMVSSRTIVEEAHRWALGRGSEIIHAPREFPEYGQHYATFFLDPHGFMLEVVSHTAI
jgi:catechol 2,3-dioxygenase-like lactoylglutathione lyase family enzyme